MIPEAVYGEVVVKGSGKQGSSLVADACKDWIEVKTVKDRQEVSALQTVLDEGEAEVVALGQGKKGGQRKGVKSLFLNLLEGRDMKGTYDATIKDRIPGGCISCYLAWKRAKSRLSK